MSDKKYLTVAPEIDRMPSGIPYIVGNEAAERFSFYGMKAILALFMTQNLLNAAGEKALMSDAEATEWVHTFTSYAYTFPIVGAILADWLFGKYRTILWLSIVYCLGHAVLALMDVHIGVDQRTILFWGLALIAVGSGGIKPCVSAHVGDQFGEKNHYLLAVVFGWFYFSINLGSTVSTLLTPYLRVTYGPSVAFAVPGILMAVATFLFWLGRHEFVHVPASGNRFWKETFSKDGVRAITNLIPLYIFVAMFWALFDQTASRWILQAEHMNREVLGWTLTSDQIQAANPILVMILIPIFSYGVYPFLGKFFQVTPLHKIGIGLFTTLPAFLVPAWLEMRIEAGETPYIGWQLFAYLLMTAAEVMVSITCLEFSYTQAPNKMKSFIMGLFLLSVAAGNMFTAQVNAYIKANSDATFLQGPNYYWFFSACMFVTALIYVVWSQFYKGQTHVRTARDEVEADIAAMTSE